MHHVSAALLGSDRLHRTLLVSAPLTSDIVHYLLDGGMLAHSAVVSGDVIVVENARRHFNYTVLVRGAPGLFVKRVQAGQPHAAATLHREASCYALLREAAAFLPRLIAYDPDENILVAERIDGAADVRLHPRLLGETLAHIRRLQFTFDSAIFTGEPPWILSLHRYAGIQHAGAATQQFIGILRANPRIGEVLDALRAAWRRDALMHGDIKFDNCLRIGERLVLVDWEMVDAGDAAWDAASVLQGYLSWWIEELATSEEGLIETIQPAMRAFWSAFGGNDLARVAAYTGARLLQHAYESMATAPALSQPALLQIQTAVNVLESPLKAATDLLGIA